jgi:predicted GH43/DUF377 family glycosyl hydrolase
MRNLDRCFEISQEDYEKALKEGAESIINPGIVMGYGVYNARVKEIDGKYYLSYTRGGGCD